MGEGYGVDGGGMGDGGARHTWTGSRRMPPTLEAYLQAAVPTGGETGSY